MLPSLSNNNIKYFLLQRSEIFHAKSHCIFNYHVSPDREVDIIYIYLYSPPIAQSLSRTLRALVGPSPSNILVISGAQEWPRRIYETGNECRRCPLRGSLPRRRFDPLTIKEPLTCRRRAESLLSQPVNRYSFAFSPLYVLHSHAPEVHPAEQTVSINLARPR